MKKDINPFSHRKARSWQKISIDVPSSLEDWTTAALFAITGNGAQTLACDTPERTTIIGYINEGPDQEATGKKINHLLQQINTSVNTEDRKGLKIDTLKEEDWGALWKEQFTPINISDRLLIRPSWEKTTAPSRQTVVAIDPGMAFGTGLHATTQLALKLIESCFFNHLSPPAGVLDVGTGTGILAITSALFGASEVMATDLDPDAVHAAQENIHSNGVEDTVKVILQDITEITGTFDLITANITHDVLIAMAAHLARLTAASGQLLLTGLLAGRQTESIIIAITGLGYAVPNILYKDEWTALLFKKQES